MMPPPPPPPPTPEEECLAGDGVVYEDGVCKTAEDLRNEGRDAEAEARAAEEAAAQRMADGKKYHGLLSATTPAVIAQPAPLTVAGSTYATQIGAAVDGVYNKGMIRLMIGNTMGSATQADEYTGTGGAARNVPNADLILGTNAKHVMGAGFATGANELKTHDAGDEVGGSFMGASGTYTCSVAECSSRRTANGIQLADAASTGAGEWNFVPNANSKYSIPDANYASYGSWIDERVFESGTTPLSTARVGAWYTSNAGTPIADLPVSGSSGTASYTGQAIGVAAFYHSLGEDANVGGAFTADAALSANFDTNMVSGSITNFDIGGHSPDWSVALGSSSIAAGQTVAGTTLADNGSVTGGTTTWTFDETADAARLAADGGGWTARFYDIPDGAHQPTGVAGGFKAQYESDGYMVGAFGAEQ